MRGSRLWNFGFIKDIFLCIFHFRGRIYSYKCISTASKHHAAIVVCKCIYLLLKSNGLSFSTVTGIILIR